MRYTVIALTFLVFAAPHAFAQGALPAFFSGSVADWSSAPLELSPQEETKFFPTIPPAEPASFQPGDGKAGAAGAPKTLAKPTGDATLDKLVSEFGDPSEPATVAAVDTAPKPFKGMLAAIQAGRDDLAFKYANQYVQYRKDLKSNTDKAMALQGLALEQAGLLPADGWQNNPQLAGLIDRNTLLKQLEAEKISKEKAEDIAGKIEGFLKQEAETADTQAFNYVGGEKKESEAVSERAEREKARRLTGSIPVDPRSRIDIYLFMMPNDTRALNQVKELERFRKIHGEAYQQNVAGMVLDTVDPILERNVQEQTGATFPFLDGRQLAAKLQIKQPPVLVFVTGTTRRVHVESGPRTAFFVDELVRIMEGR